MNRTRVKKVILFLCIFALFSGVPIALFLYYGRKQHYQKEFQDLLEGIDQSISLRDARSARRQLEEGALLVSDKPRYWLPSSWLQLIKRAYLLTDRGIDVAAFRDIAKKAYDARSYNQDILALYVASLLWSGGVERVYSLSNDLYDARYRGIRTEALLRTHPLMISRFDPSPVKIDPQLLTFLWETTGDDRFLLNAALLHMYRGASQEAFNLISHIDDPTISPTPLSLIAYEAGYLEEARSLLESQDRWDQQAGQESLLVKQTLGDLAKLTGQYEAAKSYYRKAIALEPKGTWKSYLNLSGILLEEEKDEPALEVLLEGLTHFPFSQELLLLTVLFPTPPPFLASYLNKYLHQHPQDTKIQLVQAVSFPVHPNIPESRAGALWDLFNDRPYSSEVSSYLIWFLLGVRDYEAVSVILQRSAPYESEAWISFYEGILAILQENYRKALSFLESSSEEMWEAHYNTAVVELQQKNTQAALHALSKLPLTGQELFSRTQLSQIHTLRALTLLVEGRKQEARESAQKALEFNEKNRRSHILLLQMEETP